MHQEVGDFCVKKYQNRVFGEVTMLDVLGRWSIFFFYPAISRLCVIRNWSICQIIKSIT